MSEAVYLTPYKKKKDDPQQDAGWALTLLRDYTAGASYSFSYFPATHHVTFISSDARALYSDWMTVGEDLGKSCWVILGENITLDDEDEEQVPNVREGRGRDNRTERRVR